MPLCASLTAGTTIFPERSGSTRNTDQLVIHFSDNIAGRCTCSGNTGPSKSLGDPTLSLFLIGYFLQQAVIFIFVFLSVPLHHFCRAFATRSIFFFLSISYFYSLLLFLSSIWFAAVLSRRVLCSTQYFLLFFTN